MVRTSLILLSAASIWGLACGGSDGTGDAGADSSIDADIDSSTDAGADSGIDSSMDAGIDSGADAGADSSADVGIDSGTDAGADSSTDAPVDFGTEMSFFASSTPVFDTIGSATTGDIAGDGNLIFTLPGTPPVVLRGIEAADAHCASLAAAAGSRRPNWVAYLSTHGLPIVGGGNGPQIDARDRIGSGPWYNADRDVITDAGGTALVNATFNVALGVILGEGRDANAAANTAAVAAYNLARPDEDLILNEAGMAVPAGVHDILTGSDDDGTVYDGGHAERWSIGQRTPPAGTRTQWGTCNDWDWQRFGNAPGAEFAQIGHTDIPSGGFSPSWNSAHDTTNCSQSGVASRGGSGLVYCFSPDSP